MLLTDEFISKYPDKPEHMTPLGEFVYYRTYSRYDYEKIRREVWKETVRRAIEYNCSLDKGVSSSEAELIFDNVFNLRQFPSGRTLWTGGTKVSEKYPMSNFNCAFVVMDDIMKLPELFYLLMIGTGVGVRILLSDVAKLQKIRTDVKIFHKKYEPIKKIDREEESYMLSENIENGEMEIIIGDSKEGWCSALEFLLQILTQERLSSIKTIIFNYDNVRPKGESLKTFGGTASGHISLKKMFATIGKVLNGTLTKDYEKIKDGQLSTINIYDIDTAIGANVVVGGVRRTALNHLIDENDTSMIRAKADIYAQKDDVWTLDKGITHRRMSNNSIFYEQKPTREFLHWQLQEQRYNGEPSFFNAEAARKRKLECEGTNPCFEILLRDRGLCNLTTVNIMGFVKDGHLDIYDLLKAEQLSVRMAIRMTLPTLELPKWDKVQKEDKITGCSLTGWQDAINAIGYNKEQETDLQIMLKHSAKKEAEIYSEELGIDEPKFVTTIKPEGTLSKVAGVSEGLHFVQNDYCIIRVRINGEDPLAKVAMYLGWNMNPESGETWDDYTTLVIDFPIHYTSKTKGQVSAVEQLNIYKNFQTYYTDHNTSNTISVKDSEWEDVEQWLWDNWDDMIGVSFLSLNDNVYELAPQESITKEKYEELISNMKPFDSSILPVFEKKYQEFEIIGEGCSSGVCPIR